MFLFSFDDEYEQNNDQKRRIFSILMAFQMFSIWEDKEFHIGCWAILTPEGDTSKTFMRMVFIYNISQVEDKQPTSNSNFWEILRWFGGKLIRWWWIFQRIIKPLWAGRAPILLIIFATYWIREPGTHTIQLELFLLLQRSAKNISPKWATFAQREPFLHI